MLPIVAYGSSSLKKKSVEIDENFPELKKLISQMYESMYESKGVGLAAPQIGFSIRLFIIDATPYSAEIKEHENLSRVFINPKIISETGNDWFFNEGCLSVPGINEDVCRKDTVELEYYDENFVFHKEIFTGIFGRIIQHEYDHLEGILFVDRLSAFKKTLLKGKLNKIAKGEVDKEYRMVFNNK